MCDIKRRHIYNPHCVKSVQMRSFFWSVLSRIWNEYGDLLRIQSKCRKIRTRKNSVFAQFSLSACQTSMTIDHFAEIVYGQKPLIIFLKSSVIYVRQSSKYASLWRNYAFKFSRFRKKPSVGYLDFLKKNLDFAVGLPVNP